MSIADSKLVKLCRNCRRFTRLIITLKTLHVVIAHLVVQMGVRLADGVSVCLRLSLVLAEGKLYCEDILPVIAV